ncbi:hypothetical protein EMIHUDRAFT_232106 [Emiliania huxleyi CCMP1516]|uniref:Uncharacterized protein n=2 Tax=Emiliania huxleyi TaxID=2903 RepID=A0A0D3K6D7_EMIH1|nr:hypothetical protein EMIHUDRAFT_232106 [Emiliania huxleyi CCMP1516]EOD31322.1 hypothetical protein EMIHUDRAFT_232106 [Emiliania huxleyi CCMP1516]|eukprot:XP_005783751.1 hypothetical protein EMIHUDRAFT_232106 [Emiliania huxleyi CCMP1516]
MVGKSVKAPWTRQEDIMIRDGVLQRGFKWTAIAKSLPHKRSADAVRNRWQRLQSRRRGTPPPALMRPRSDGEADSEGGASAEGSGDGADVGEDFTPPEVEKHGDMWTEEEDSIIDNAVAQRGPCWAAIAQLLPGRTYSGCRNRWVRLQERRLAAAGLHVKGAAQVTEVLRRLGFSWGSDANATDVAVAAQRGVDPHASAGVAHLAAAAQLMAAAPWAAHWHPGAGEAA